MKKLILTFALFHLISITVAQDYGSLKKIDKDLLLRDLELLHQGLDKHHSGMYWYTPKDSVDRAFSKAKAKINKDLYEIEFFNVVAPLVGISREDHTNIEFSEETEVFLNEKARYLPLVVVFLDKKMYVSRESKLYNKTLLGHEIISINGKSPLQLVNELGELFASDGFIKAVKFSDLNGFSFSKHHFLKYGFINEYTIEVKDLTGSVGTIHLKPQSFKDFKESIITSKKTETNKESLEFRVLNDTIAYLGVHTFSNYQYKQNEINKNLSRFLETSFKEIQELNIKNLIIDVSENGGGNERNENLLFSYIDDNYRKYKSVCAKSQVSILDDGIDNPIKLKTFGFFERIFTESKIPSQSINPSYGYLWWLNGKSSYMLPSSQTEFNGMLVTNAPSEMVAAMGKDEQRIYIVPSQNLVIVRMGEATVSGDNFALSSFDNMFWEKFNEVVN